MNTATLLQPGERVRAVQPTGRIKVTAGHDDRATITAVRTALIHVSTPGPQGPAGVGVPGPPGPLGGYVITQPVPAATWSYTHTVGRLPVVNAYDMAGRRIFPDTTATDTQVVLTFAVPMAGRVVLT